MSVQAISWAFAAPTPSSSSKLVLLALANRHHPDTGLCWPRVKTIAAETQLSEKTVRRMLDVLEEAELIARERDRYDNGTFGGYVYSFPSITTGQSDHWDTTGHGDRSRKVRPYEEEGLRVEEVQKPGQLALRQNGDGAVAQRGPTIRIPPKVGRSPVTAQEGRDAVAILAIWNELAGQKLCSAGVTKRIIMRLRERPDLTLDDHRAAIAATLASDWWEGTAYPTLLYGNENAFERALLRAQEGPGRVKPPPRKFGYGLLNGEIESLAASGALDAACDELEAMIPKVPTYGS